MESQVAKRSYHGCRFYKSYRHDTNQFKELTLINWSITLWRSCNEKMKIKSSFGCCLALGKNVCHPYYSFSILIKCEENMLKRVKKFDEYKK